MQLSFGKLQIPIFLAMRASCDETSVRNFERAHTFNNRVCKTVAYRIHSIFIKTIRVRIFRKHPSKLTIKTLRFRAMRNLQRARSAKFPAQLATSAEREVPRATCHERGARSSPRRNREYLPYKKNTVSVFLLRSLAALFRATLFIHPPLLKQTPSIKTYFLSYVPAP